MTLWKPFSNSALSKSIAIIKRAFAVSLSAGMDVLSNLAEISFALAQTSHMVLLLLSILLPLLSIFNFASQLLNLAPSKQHLKLLFPFYLEDHPLVLRAHRTSDIRFLAVVRDHIAHSAIPFGAGFSALRIFFSNSGESIFIAPNSPPTAAASSLRNCFAPSSLSGPT